MLDLENFQETLTKKTGPIPNWVLLAGGVVLVWWLLRPQPKTATTVKPGASPGTFSSPTPGPVASTTPVIVGPAPTGGIPSTGSQPCANWPDCDESPLPSASPPPSQWGPQLPTPQQVAVIAPFAALGVSPQSITPGTGITVTVSGMSGADKAEIWASGTADINGRPPVLGWSKFGALDAPGGILSMPTEDYAFARGGKIFVALELRKDGSVVATGNPNAAGYDGRLIQTVLVF